MSKKSFFTILVSLFLSLTATPRRPENKVLTGTIQYPATLHVPISPATIVYQGEPVPAQVDRKNNAITFEIKRKPRDFTFSFLSVNHKILSMYGMIQAILPTYQTPLNISGSKKIGPIVIICSPWCQASAMQKPSM